jgi:hypothetical protein
MRQPAARLKGLKGSVWALKDPDTEQYIAFGNEHQAPRLAPLHLATLARDTDADLAALKQLASRRLQGQRYCLERIDAVHTSGRRA